MNAKVPGNFTPEKAALLISRRLRQLGDRRHAVSTQRFFTEPVQALGVDTPTLRSITRLWVKRLKTPWGLKEAIALSELLFQSKHLEIRAAGFLVLGGFEKEFSQALFRRSERWVRLYFDNWACVDGFSSAVLSPLLRRYPGLAGALRRWLKSRCMWVRRAALVSLVPLARRGEQLDLAFDLAEQALVEQEDLMHKALGWLLREAGKSDSTRLKAFLLRHRASIPRTSVRYSIERFPARVRAELLRATREAGGPPLPRYRAK